MDDCIPALPEPLAQRAKELYPKLLKRLRCNTAERSLQASQLRSSNELTVSNSDSGNKGLRRRSSVRDRRHDKALRSDMNATRLKQKQRTKPELVPSSQLTTNKFFSSFPSAYAQNNFSMQGFDVPGLTLRASAMPMPYAGQFEVANHGFHALSSRGLQTKPITVPSNDHLNNAGWQLNNNTNNSEHTVLTMNTTQDFHGNLQFNELGMSTLDCQDPDSMAFVPTFTDDPQPTTKYLFK